MKTSTGSKYEQPSTGDAASYRNAPTDVVYRIAEIFGVAFEDDTGDTVTLRIEQKTQTASVEDLRVLEFCHAHNITLQDLARYLKVRDAFSD